MPTLTMVDGDPGEKLKVFISYSRRDASEFADELAAGLEIAGFAPFLDRHDIAAGEDWEARLGGLIAQSDTVVFVVSPESVKSERCVWEVDRTLAQSKRLLPVVCKPVTDAEIPAALSRLQFVRFDGRGLARPLAELAEALRADLDWIREHTRLSELAARFAARGKPEALLLRGEELEAAKRWAAARRRGAPDITEGQRALLLASDDAERARLDQERAQIEEMRVAQAATAQALQATARQQRRAAWQLRGIAALLLVIFTGVTWQGYEVARREVAVFTSLAAQAMQDGQFDRAMRYALQAYPARGAVPGLTPFSSELEGKLAGGAQLNQLHRVLRGHALAVRRASFSPDDSKVLTSSDDGTARIWDAQGGAELLVFKMSGTPTPILSAVFTPDGKGVLMGVGDGTARIWDAADGHETMVLKGHQGPVYQAVFSPDGTRIATASLDTTARIWDAQSGREVAVLRGHTKPLDAVSFSASGHRLVTLSREESAVRVWDLDTGKEIGAFTSTDGVMFDAMLDAAGQRLITTDISAARIWDVDRHAELFTLETGSVQQVTFSRDGKRALTRGGATVRIWDAETGKEIRTLTMPANSGVSEAAFDREETRVATASYDDVVRIWDLASGSPVATLRGHTGSVLALAFSSDGKRLASASNDTTARIWRTAEAIVVTLKDYKAARAAFSPDGHRIVTASFDNSARIWDADDGREILRLDGHTGAVTSAAFDPQGKRVVTASNDHTVRLWDAATGKQISVLQGHTDTVWSAAFDPAGKRIVSAGRDLTARIWDAESGKLLLTVPHDGWIRSAAFAPDGRRVVTAIDRGRAYIWDPQDLAHFIVLEGHTSIVESASFDRTGRRVVTASLDGTARIWDAASGQELMRLQSAKGEALQSAQFNPEGDLAVAAASDGSTVIWDLQSGQEIVALPGEAGGIVGAAAFGPDGTRLLAGHGAATHIWDVTWAAKVRGEALRERVCAEKLVGAAQEFTDTELANPILRDIDRNDPIARNPCLRRGPLTVDFWLRLPGRWWHMAQGILGRH